jgi:glycosyltransferase involved in cell wall biosynthesis
MKPSIILPCFNGARWLRFAIDSVLSQTYGNFEFIIINDGSTDSSEEIILSYLSDKRITYVDQKNKGFSASINRGIRESNGEFIGFIGQDDIWLPNKLKLQVNYLNQHKNVDLVYSSFYHIDSKGEVFYLMDKGKDTSFHGRNVIKDLFYDNYIGFETVLVNKKCFEEVGCFDERMLAFSDHDMWLRMVSKFNFGYITLPLVKKRFHDNNLSDVKTDVLIDEFLLAKKTVELYPFLKESLDSKLAQLYYDRGIAYLQKRHISEARRDLLNTVRLQPWKLVAIIAYITPGLYTLLLTNWIRFNMRLRATRNKTI